MWTLPLGLMSFQSQFSQDYGQLNAAIVMTVLPAILVYLIFQRYFVSGLTSGRGEGVGQRHGSAPPGSHATATRSSRSGAPSRLTLEGPAGGQPVPRRPALERPSRSASREITRPRLLRRRRHLPRPLHARRRGRAGRYRTRSNAPPRSTARPARFDCAAPRRRATTGRCGCANRFHFAYADGTPYFPFGTTCYAWTHQPLDDAGADARDARQRRASTRSAWASSPRTTPTTTNEPLHDCLPARRRRASSTSTGRTRRPSGTSRRQVGGAPRRSASRPTSSSSTPTTAGATAT